MSVPLIIHADRHTSGWLNARGGHNAKKQNRPNLAAPFPRHNCTMLRRGGGSFSQRDACEKCPKHLELSRVLRSHARGHNYGGECVASLISYWNVGIVPPTNDDYDDDDNDDDDSDDWL